VAPTGPTLDHATFSLIAIHGVADIGDVVRERRIARGPPRINKITVSIGDISEAICKKS